jgi:hypothetical protein
VAKIHPTQPPPGKRRGRYTVAVNERDSLGLETEGEPSTRKLKVSGDDLDYLFYQALKLFGHPRVESLLAELVLYQLEGSEETTPEPWHGYNEALDQLSQAAAKIRDGWEEHDKVLFGSAAPSAVKASRVTKATNNNVH